MTNCFKLTHLDTVVIDGPDAVAFAQAQFTHDVEDMGGHSWHPGAWCDPRGRALVVMLARRCENGLVLAVPTAQVELLLARLPLFAIGRKVEIRHGSGVCGRFCAAGEDGELVHDPARAVRVDDGSCGRDEDALWRWQQADLANRFPWLGPETSGRHLPQSLGLEQLGGLSFGKGCFPGQEVIARVHYLGKVKYRTVEVSFAGVRGLAPGRLLRSKDDSRVGELLWGLEREAGVTALAVVDSDLADGVEIFADADNERACGRVSL